MFRSAWCGNSAGNWDPLHSVHLVALRLAALPFVASSSALHRLHPLDLAMTCDMAPRWTQVLARSKICQPGEMPPRRHQVISLLYAIWQKFKDQIMIQIQKALLIQSAPASILHFSGHSRCPGGLLIDEFSAKQQSVWIIFCGKKLIRKRTPKFTLREKFTQSIEVHVPNCGWNSWNKNSWTLPSFSPWPRRHAAWHRGLEGTSGMVSPMQAWQDRKCYKSMIVDYCALILLY